MRRQEQPGDGAHTVPLIGKPFEPIAGAAVLLRLVVTPSKFSALTGVPLRLSATRCRGACRMATLTAPMAGLASGAGASRATSGGAFSSHASSAK